jgi:phenylacetate-CoA ligase
MTVTSVPSGPTRWQHPAMADDFLPLAVLRQRQTERLRTMVDSAARQVAWYRDRYRTSGVSAEQLRSPDDLVRFPLISKVDLQAAYPQGLFAVPLSQVARLHASSGTTGRQVLVPYTREDLAVWTSAMVRSLLMFGIGPSDVIQNA